MYEKFEYPVAPQEKAPPSKENTSEKESSRELQENDLIIPEGDIEIAEPLLQENGFLCKREQYTEGIDFENSSRVPSEFILKIESFKNTDNTDDSPLTFEDVKRAFELLRSHEIVVRYAKNPEKEASAENPNDSSQE